MSHLGTFLYLHLTHKYPEAPQEFSSGTKSTGGINPPKSDKPTRGEASGAGNVPHAAMHHLTLSPSLDHGACLLPGLLVEDLPQTGPFPGQDLDSFMASVVWEDVILTSHPLAGSTGGRGAGCDEPGMLHAGCCSGITPSDHSTGWHRVREQHHPTAIPHPTTPHTTHNRSRG